MKPASSFPRLLRAPLSGGHLQEMPDVLEDCKGHTVDEIGIIT